MIREANRTDLQLWAKYLSRAKKKGNITVRGIKASSRDEKLDDAAKIVGIKHLVPLDLLNGKLRGERFDTYEKIKAVEVDYLCDRSVEEIAKEEV